MSEKEKKPTSVCLNCGEDPKSGKQAFVNGEWVPARPVNYKYRTFRERILESWDVFFGKADARYWKGQ